jgi:hypothetical protein
MVPSFELIFALRSPAQIARRLSKRFPRSRHHPSRPGVRRYLSAMRTLALVLAFLTPLPVVAWDVTLGDICTLSHETREAAVRLTYDPARPLYTITVTHKGATWPRAEVFGMAFAGAVPIQIVTDRHWLSDGDTSLTVADTGFGNVLDGLQFNETATAIAGNKAVSFPLEGAAGPVAAFRACAPALSS